MPECLLLAYHQHLDRLRAERSLDAAQASSVPHLTKEGHTSWYRQIEKRTSRRVIAGRSSGGAEDGAPLFTVDGRVVDKAGLARWLSRTFGGSVFATAPTNGASHEGAV